MIFEIVILAMIAAFLGLRLYSVLGRRAEHEEESIPTRYNPRSAETETGQSLNPTSLTPEKPADGMWRENAEQGVRAIVMADARFDVHGFLEGAKGAYRMVLEAFWKGDRDTLRHLCDSDVFAGFDAAIAQREAAGEVLNNRLVRIEEALIDSARLDGGMASITVRFTADIAAVTRDKDGVVVAGSLDDAIETRDVWTFKRDMKSSSPDWILDETDEG